MACVATSIGDWIARFERTEERTSSTRPSTAGPGTVSAEG